MDDTLRRHRQMLAAMTAAADAVSSPANQVTADLGRRMAALNRQADDLLAVRTVTELTSLERERMGLASGASSALSAPDFSTAVAPVAATTSGYDGGTSTPLKSLRSGGVTVPAFDDHDHRRKGLRDVASALSSFTASLPVDRPLTSQGPDWMARARSSSFATAMGPSFAPPVLPPSEAPGEVSLGSPGLQSLPRAASHSATLSSPAAPGTSSSPATDAVVHYSASLGAVPAAARGSAGEGLLASHASAASAISDTPVAPPPPPRCARTPSTSALKLATEAPEEDERLRMALFERVQRTSLPTPLPLSDTLLDGVVTELTSAEYEAQLRLNARPYSDRAAAVAEARTATEAAAAAEAAAEAGAAAAAAAAAASPMASGGGKPLAVRVPPSPAVPPRVDSEVGGTALNGDAGPTTRMLASPALSHGAAASPGLAPGALPTASCAARHAASREALDGTTLLGALNGALGTLEPLPAPTHQRLSGVALSVCASDPDGFVHYPSSPARVPHRVQRSPMHIEGVPLALCLRCYDCPCSCAGGGPVARAAAMPRLC